MRNAISFLAAALLSVLIAGSAYASMDQFAGYWTNVDPNTGGITTLDIAVSGTDVQVHAWGKCHPTDCDWGTVTAQPFAPDVSSDIASTAQALLAVFVTDFSETTLIIKPEGDGLIVDDFDRFTDRSGRSNYVATYTFQRSQAPGGEVPGTEQPAVQLAAPVQTSPPDGVTFYHYPRTTTLTWEPVEGAASYTVEVDCFHCCQNGAWCTDVGQTYVVKTGLTEPVYTFDYVGAQPGRWRVWATGPSGEEGPKSGWWNYEYTK